MKLLDRPGSAAKKSVPLSAPWLDDESTGSDEEIRLRARVEALEAAVADKDKSIEFLRDLLTDQFFDTEV